MTQTIKHEIRNRWTNAVQFTAEITCAPDATIGVRDWGFWCGADGERFVPWWEFVAAGDPGSIGPGCGEG